MINPIPIRILAESGAADQVRDIARSFGVDWPHLIAQVVSFAIVCLVLYKWAYKPILAMLELRRAQIAESLANAEKIKAELATTASQRKDVIAQARQQAAKAVEDAHSAAAKIQESEIQKAMAAARQIADEARLAAQRDRDRMFAELRHEVGRLVVNTTAAVIGRTLTPEDQQRLLADATNSLAASPAPEAPAAGAKEISESLLRQGQLGVTGDESQPQSPTRR